MVWSHLLIRSVRKEVFGVKETEEGRLSVFKMTLIFFYVYLEEELLDHISILF